MKKQIYFFLLVIGTTKAQTQTNFPEHQSQLLIPYNYQSYMEFEKGIYAAPNLHTSIKPFIYNKVAGQANLETSKTALLLQKKTWGGKKLWNTHLVEIREKNYWANLDVLLDLSAGRENGTIGTTLQNSRILKLEGQLGKKLSYAASVFETQEKFPQYIHEYIKIQQPEDGAGLIPGRGKAKAFGETGFDYGVSTGYISYAPSTFFNLQFGHGQNFIGDGYRSLFLSDVAAPNTYAKVTTTVGKIQYTNLWTWLRDFNFSIDNDPANNAAHKRKYGVFHHLSWNVSSRFNLGFFEGIISDNSGTSGALQAEYWNPIIFYKNVEFSNGENAGSGVVGLDAKVHLGKHNYLYGQFLLDEFSAQKFFKQNGYWANKYGFQLGAKLFDAFALDGFTLQLEYNKVRPFTYAHEEQHNYAHFGQPLAHLWGANFWESILIASYTKDRWRLHGKFIFGKKGFDVDGDATSFGGNIFIDSSNRNADFNQKSQQGNLAEIVNIDVQVHYVINPANNLRLYAGAVLRNFTSQSKVTRVGIVPESTGFELSNGNTQWLVLGLKTNLFNSYRDY